MYLVDTNVLSVSAPTETNPSSRLVVWMERNTERLFLSAIAIAEIQYGIVKARRSGSVAKANRLEDWLASIVHLYRDRVLPLDVAVAKVLGRLVDQTLASGQVTGWGDLAIAATAASHGYTVLTRNLRHFRHLTITALDPFESLPEG